MPKNYMKGFDMLITIKIIKMQSQLRKELR